MSDKPYVLSDIPKDWDEDFDRRELEDIVDELNKCHIYLTDKVGGVYEFIDSHHDEFRVEIINAVLKSLDKLLVDSKWRFGDALRPAIEGIYAELGGVVTDENPRQGNASSDDYIEDQYADNPLMRGARRGRGNARGGRDSRDGYRRNTSTRPRGRYDARDTRDSVNRSPRDNDYRNTGRTGRPHRAGGEAGRPRGRLVTNNTPVEKEVKEQTVVIDMDTPTAKVNEVVTADNLPRGADIAPLYIIGEEQVVVDTDGSLKLIPYEGTTAVDYEKHRVDRFFKDTLGSINASSSNGITSRTIAAAERAIDNKIEAFVNKVDEENPDMEMMVPSLNLFDTKQPFVYTNTIDASGRTMDPVQLRNTMMEAHGGDPQWFARFALIAPVVQIVDFSGTGNDIDYALKALLDATTLTEFVSKLVGLAVKIDAANWRFMHDLFTSELNRVLISELGIPTQVDSITADWNDLVKFITESNKSAASLLASTGVRRICEFVELSASTDDKPTQIRLNRTFLFLPLATYEFEIASATQAQGTGRILENSKLFKLVNNIQNEKFIGLTTIVTLDGAMIEVCQDRTTLTGIRYYAKLIKG